MQTNIYVSWNTSKLRVRLALGNWFKLSSKIFVLTVPRRYLRYFCLVFVMLLGLFMAAFSSPAGKELASWLTFVMFKCVFFHFPMWYPGSGVVLDCIDSWYLPLFVLLYWCKRSVFIYSSSKWVGLGVILEDQVPIFSNWWPYLLLLIVTHLHIRSRRVHACAVAISDSICSKTSSLDFKNFISLCSEEWF